MQTLDEFKIKANANTKLKVVPKEYFADCLGQRNFGLDECERPLEKYFVSTVVTYLFKHTFHVRRYFARLPQIIKKFVLLAGRFNLYCTANDIRF